jgi:hypothetical protein
VCRPIASASRAQPEKLVAIAINRIVQAVSPTPIRSRLSTQLGPFWPIAWASPSIGVSTHLVARSVVPPCLLPSGCAGNAETAAVATAL